METRARLPWWSEVLAWAVVLSEIGCLAYYAMGPYVESPPMTALETVIGLVYTLSATVLAIAVIVLRRRK